MWWISMAKTRFLSLQIKCCRHDQKTSRTKRFNSDPRDVAATRDPFCLEGLPRYLGVHGIGGSQCSNAIATSWGLDASPTVVTPRVSSRLLRSLLQIGPHLHPRHPAAMPRGPVGSTHGPPSPIGCPARAGQRVRETQKKGSSLRSRFASELWQRRWQPMIRCHAQRHRGRAGVVTVSSGKDEGINVHITVWCYGLRIEVCTSVLPYVCHRNTFIAYGRFHFRCS